MSHKSLGKIFQIGVEQAKVPCEAWPVAILQRRVRSWRQQIAIYYYHVWLKSDWNCPTKWKGCVCTLLGHSSWFCDSRSLGHTAYLNVLPSLEDSVRKIDTTRMIQGSMDGRNTNLKVLEEYQKKRVEGELPQFIDIGTCNLHIIHGAFETEATKCCWNLKKLLKGVHRILNDTPAQICHLWQPGGLKTRVYQTEWLNCSMILRNCLISGKALQSPRPKSKSYENVKAHINNSLTLAKLKFFSFVASLLEL